ncbi:hypothetical protein RPALISO_214 [Ruegeria phage RpAliso]|nr:hypothetical protein RPALISO_214 [Ruegeria phage RpAliso]
MTASLKGYFEPKTHLGRDGKTFCGKDWKDMGWMLIETREELPPQTGDYCARCMKKALAEKADA